MKTGNADFMPILQTMKKLLSPAIIVSAYDLGQWYGFQAVVWDVKKYGPYSKEKALKECVWTEYDCVNKKTGDRLFLRTVDVMMHDLDPIELKIPEGGMFNGTRSKRV